MKSYLIVALVVLASCADDFGDATDYHYFVQGEKIQLVEDRRFVQIKFADYATKEMREHFAFIYGAPNAMVLSDKYVRLRTRPSTSLALLRNQPGVESVNYCLRNQNGYLIGYTNEFIVGVKDDVSYQEFQDLISTNSVEIIRQYEFQIYTLKITNESPYNAVDMANKFYGSDLVEWAEPNFVSGGVLN